MQCVLLGNSLDTACALLEVMRMNGVLSCANSSNHCLNQKDLVRSLKHYSACSSVITQMVVNIRSSDSEPMYIWCSSLQSK